MSLEGRNISVSLDKAVRKLKTDFFLTTSGAFFASEELATLLKLFRSDLQTPAAEARYSNGKSTERRYRLVDCERRLSCFDYDRSEYAGKPLVLQRLERGKSPDSFMVMGIRSLVMNQDCLGDANFFFLKNVVLTDPIVSEPLAAAIKANGLNVRLDPIA